MRGTGYRRLHRNRATVVYIATRLSQSIQEPGYRNVHKNRATVVYIITGLPQSKQERGYRLNDTSFESRQSQDIFLFTACSLWCSPSLVFIDHRVSVPEVKWPECAIEISPSPSVEVKKGRATPLLLLQAFATFTGPVLPYLVLRRNLQCNCVSLKYYCVQKRQVRLLITSVLSYQYLIFQFAAWNRVMLEKHTGCQLLKK